ncbi:MAG: amidoligase family protein [Roseicyclus sp.]|nr:amidoligase family protein [Roseicyclus sp.]MBO6623720.1 amidoligase family protein [Roseicyclus sp.]MBO6922827.1 amidoligase family protein [Roseicyclus sp.]
MSFRAEPLDLPTPTDMSGDRRKVGVEIELAGLSEKELAHLIADECGGTVEEEAAHEFRVLDTDLGDIEVYLDTAFRKSATSKWHEAGLDLAREIVPVEIVTAPLDPNQLGHLDSICATARENGAIGSRSGWLLGFGVHLNVQIKGERLEDVLPTLQAYALCEDVLRHTDPIDTSRRLLPFVDPYSRALVDCLAKADFRTIGDLIAAYLETDPTRDRGLDMLPVFKHIDQKAVDAAVHGLSPVSARPAYHYRLPDCRIDEPDWSVGAEWARWVAIERIAEDGAVLAELASAWADHRAALTTLRTDWAQTAMEILSRSGHRELLP